MGKKDSEDFDWFTWAGLEHTSLEKLRIEAGREDVPVFAADTEKDLYDRTLAAKTLKNNHSTIRMNKKIAVITSLSAVVSIVAAIVGML
ncbi:MAG: hypothetical protein ACJAS1_002396 [Oleiphilaceae bacterium]|jgi:hypothetical protein